MIDATTGKIYCYHFNALGSTIALTDSTQAIVNKYAYTPFGAVTEQETVNQPFKYVGQYGVTTEPNGLYYMRARYYDPLVGRFISEDPSGFDSGDVNFYAYVSNNPISYIDPLGLNKAEGGSVLIDISSDLNSNQAMEMALNFSPVGEEKAFSEIAENLTAKITGYTFHGINQAISRDGGKGVAVSSILDAVKNPVEVVSKDNGVIKYVGQEATVVLNKFGKVITTYGKPRN